MLSYTKRGSRDAVPAAHHAETESIGDLREKGFPYMASMTIRNLDDSLKACLRIRAATHGKSMEDEARDILRAALSADAPRTGLFKSVRTRLRAAGGGVDLELPAREAIRTPAGLDE